MNKRTKEKVLVIASAGGHLTQAMCATSLIGNIVLVSHQNSIKESNVKKIYKLFNTQFNPFIHFINLIFAFYIILKEKPISIFSTGGPITLPFALLSKLLSINYIYLDTLSRVTELSNTAKFLLKFKLQTEIFTQWKKVAKQNNIQYIGKTFDILNESYTKVGLLNPVSTATILVTMGTNPYPFTRLEKLLLDHSLYSNSNVKWLIQTGGLKLKHPPKNGEVFDMVSRQKMDEMVKESHLVISHCGVGTINLMLRYQKKAIFVPRISKYNEFSDDHQLQIANEINGKRFQVVFPDQPLPDFSLTELIETDRYSEAIDVTNYQLAKTIRDVLLN